jgi:predicted transcriptional regulator
MSTVATSIKLSAELKSQIDAHAEKAGISAHAFMVQAISDATNRMALREQFDADTRQAMDELMRTGMAIAEEDVVDYFAQKKAWRMNGADPATKPAMPSAARVFDPASLSDRAP